MDDRRKSMVSRLRLTIVAALSGIVLAASSQVASAELSADMQSNIAALVNEAVAKEDADGLNNAINDLCAAHPDITAEIVTAFATELANKRPLGFCKGASGPCLDMADIIEQLRRNLLATVEPEPYTRELLQDNQENQQSECQDSGCFPPIVEISETDSASPDQL